MSNLSAVSQGSPNTSPKGSPNKTSPKPAKSGPHRPFDGRRQQELKQMVEAVATSREQFEKALQSVQEMDTKAEEVMEVYGNCEVVRQKREKAFLEEMQKKHLKLVDEALERQNKVRVSQFDLQALRRSENDRLQESNRKRRKIEEKYTNELLVQNRKVDMENASHIEQGACKIAALIAKKAILEETIQVMRKEVESQKSVTSSVARVAPIMPIVMSIEHMKDTDRVI